MKTLALALALSLVATAAPAENGNWQLGNDQIHIVDDTIDITSPVGRMHLLRRVERAAEKLCRDRAGTSRRECEVETVRQTAQVRSHLGRALASALRDRGAVQMAARWRAQ